jgi:protocatechuate 3,4-dioxygenase beta subunit
MPTRRSFVLGGLGSLFLVACSDDDEDPAAASSSATTAPADPRPTAPTEPPPTGGEEPEAEPSEPSSLTPSDFAELAVCQLLPEEVEGPFYLDDDLARRDLTDGRAGHALRLGLLIVDETCTALESAAVDVWHAAPDGEYSGFGAAGPGTTFLRGTQVSDRNGIVEFATLYPGWYRGRAVHIHVKVHLEDSTLLTTQLVFDDGFSDQVFAAEPYAARGERDTRNDDDRIIGDYETNGTLLTTRPAGDGTLALAVIGVDPSGAAGGQSLLSTSAM